MNPGKKENYYWTMGEYFLNEFVEDSSTNVQDKSFFYS